MELPISLKIENAKGNVLSVLNDVSVEYNLPAFILEGIISDILSDVRSQAKIELLNDVNAILNKKTDEEGDKNDDNEPKS